MNTTQNPFAQKPVINPNRAGYVKPNKVETVAPPIKPKIMATERIPVPDKFEPVTEPIKVDPEVAQEIAGCDVDIHENVTVKPVQDVTALSPQEALEEAIKAAGEEAEKNEDITHVRDIQHQEYAGRDPAELIPEDGVEVKEGVAAVERTFQTDATGKPLFAQQNMDPCPPAEVSIFDTEEMEEQQEKKFSKAIIGVIGNKNPNMEEADMARFVDLMLAYRRDNSISIYNKLPQSVKAQVMNICMQAGAPINNSGLLNKIAKMMMDEMIAETAQDQAFIDFEKSLNEAMKIPSLTDIYQEGMRESIEEKLPAMADAIEKEDPKKAQLLRDIADRYRWSRNFTLMYQEFDSNARTRKLMRRDHEDWMRCCDEVNFRNADTKFRMNDCRSIAPTLWKAIANAKDNDITMDEVNKFVVLFCRTIITLDPKELVDAAYIYYAIKHMTMLAYRDPTKSEAADSFSAELISNIKTLIYYIRAKEADHVNTQPSNKKLKRSQRRKLEKRNGK